MAEVKLKEELELWEPAEVDNSVVDQIKEEADDRGVQRGNESCSSLVQMKEEPVEFSIKQEPLQEFPFIRVIVKSEDEEDKSSVLHLKIIEETEENRQETNGADPGLDKHSESARDTQTDDTDDSEQWTGPTEASAEQLEIDLHKQDCNLPHVKGLQGAVNDAGDKIKQHKCPACAKRFQSKRSGADHASKTYRIVQQIPSDSSEDDVSGSDDEWLPEKRELANGSSSDSEAEDVEGAEDAEEVEGAEEDVGAEDVLPDKAQVHKKSRHVWKIKDNEFEGNLPPFLGEWKVNIEGTEPIDFFMHLFPEELIDEIVLKSNLYALQKGKENLAITNGEMKQFLGINLVMSYLRYPRSRMYWSSEEGLRLDLIANAMPLNRFEQILRYIHFVDNYSQEQRNTDKLFNIRPVLDTLKKTFRSAVDPEEFQSIDEQIIPFKGCLSLKQYIPNKSKPWGVKVWVRAGSSGYMHRFEVYQGLAGHGAVSRLGNAADVVMRLCDDIQQKNHKVFFDNFFCTIPLIQALKQQGIYGTGTCRSNRLQGAQLKLKSETKLKEEGRGSCSIVTNAENITVTRWLDSSVIHIASSCVGQSPSDVSQRWSKKEKKMLNIQRPFSVKLYNQHMGGVDLMDQCVAMYPHRRKNKRWYLRVFFHFLDVTTVNAWHIYRMCELDKKDLLHFKASVARALVNATSIQTPRRGRPSATPPPLKRRAVSKPSPEIKFGPGDHWPRLTEAKNANRCHDSACTRKTKYICMQCLVALCPGCFANFHTR